GTHRQGREPGRAPDHAAPQAGDAEPREAAGAIAPSIVARPVLEVADILREHGPAWREANCGHVSLDQLKVMSAIERCRTVALGGHVARCENAACGHTLIASVTGIARNARLPPHADGWPIAKRSSCRRHTFTSSTRCRASCVTLRTRTSAWSTTC